MKIQIKNNQVLFTKLFNEKDKQNALLEIPEDAKKILFIDTPPTEILYQLIKELSEKGIECILIDHHNAAFPETEREKEIAEMMNKIKSLISPHSRIGQRKHYPACSLLLDSLSPKIEFDFIIADSDFDGLLSSMKASRVTYPDLDEDAIILDGERAKQTKENLSEAGFALFQAFSVLPEFNPKEPSVYENAKKELFENFIKVIEGDKKVWKYFKDKETEYEEMISATSLVLKSAEEVVPGVWFTEISRIGGRKVHLQTIMENLENRPGCKVTAIKKDSGPIVSVGKFPFQISVCVVGKYQDKINLQDAIPTWRKSHPENGVISNTRFLLHVNDMIWEKEVIPRLKDMV